MDVVWPIGPTFSSATEDLGGEYCRNVQKFFYDTHTHSERESNKPDYAGSTFLARSVFERTFNISCRICKSLSIHTYIGYASRYVSATRCGR